MEAMHGVKIILNRRSTGLSEFRKQVETAIPALRRYARALSGSQTSGDAYVSAVLEALVR